MITTSSEPVSKSIEDVVVTISRESRLPEQKTTNQNDSTPNETTKHQHLRSNEAGLFLRRKRTRVQPRSDEMISPRIPLPTCIELHNLFLKEPLLLRNRIKSNSNTIGSHSSKRWQRYDMYQSDMLYRVKLEVIVRTLYYDDEHDVTGGHDSNLNYDSAARSAAASNAHNNNANDLRCSLRNIATDNKYCVMKQTIYNRVCTEETICPIWRHLNEDKPYERIATLGGCHDEPAPNCDHSHGDVFRCFDSHSKISYDHLSADEYNSMFVRISVVRATDGNDESEHEAFEPESNRENECDTNHARNVTYGCSDDVYKNEYIQKSNVSHSQAVMVNPNDLTIKVAGSLDDFHERSPRYDSFEASGDTGRANVSPKVNRDVGTDDAAREQQHQKYLANNKDGLLLSDNFHPKIETKKTRTLKSKSWILETPIHPSKLAKIGGIPPHLPLNCLIVHYSDGTIRVQPMHYLLLFDCKQDGVVINTGNQNNIITHPKRSNTLYSKLSSLSQQSSFEDDDIPNEENDDIVRPISHFEDEVFLTLDSVASTTTTTKSAFPNNTTAMKSLPRSAAASHPAKSLTRQKEIVFPDLLPNTPSSFRVENANCIHPTNLIGSVTTSKLALDDEKIDILSNDTPYSDYVGKMSEATMVALVPTNGIRYDQDRTEQKTDENVFVLSHNTTNVSRRDVNNISERFVYSEQDRMEQTKLAVVSNQRQQQDELQLHREQEYLEQLLLEEETQYILECLVVKQNAIEMKQLMKQINSIEQCYVPYIKQQIEQELIACRKSRFAIEAQRIRLIHELATNVYPITVVLKQKAYYYIRNIEVPKIELGGSGNASESIHLHDDDVSAAFGFTCHCVYMLSSYLDVPLRYKLICLSSRSCVMGDYTRTVDMTSKMNGSSNRHASPQPVYPLYLNRNTAAEREIFEYAVHLLNCNVDNICKVRAINITPPMITAGGTDYNNYNQRNLSTYQHSSSGNIHILAKIKRIFETIIEGY